MIAFDASGNVRWTVPNDYPLIATADGGVIGQSGIIYDQNGQATGQIPNLAAYSWTGNSYQDGPVDQVLGMMLNVAESFTAFAGGNPSGNGTATKPVTKDVQQLIAQIALNQVGSLQWASTGTQNYCNLFVQWVLEQAGLQAPLSPNPSWYQRAKYYLHLASSPTYPATAGDWANPSTDLKCWRPVTVNTVPPPVGPQLPPGTLPPDISIPGDVIAEAINYADGATGHVGIIVGDQETASSDSVASCFPPYSPDGIIDISNFGFRPADWVDTYINRLTGQPCRTHGKEINAAVKRFVCQ